MARIIAIANQKGGVGKTTTTINLCACLAEKRKVLAIDLDPQGNTSSGLGAGEDGYSIYDVLIDEYPAENAVQKTNVNGLDIIKSIVDLAGAEIEMVNMISRENVLKRTIKPILDQYDYILIDCPPSLGLLTLNALTAADSILVPIQCEYFALEGLSQLMNTVRIVQKHLNPELVIEGVVLTMYDGRTNLSSQVVAEVKKHFDAKVYRTIIPRSIRLGEAPSFGEPITTYAPKSTGAAAYYSLRDEVITGCEGGY